MPIITQIQHDNKTKRVLVYIDYRFCASIKPNIWERMNLSVGSEISCAKLHQKEALIWKAPRKMDSIYLTKHAINRTVDWFAKYLPNLEAKVINCSSGTDGNALSFSYPNVRNDQNIRVDLKGTTTELITLEVATPDIRRSMNHCVRSDKLEYAQSQSEKDAWVVLYYQYPIERFVWVKPISGKEYQREELIGGSKDYFVLFNEKSPEVYSFKMFCDYIRNKINLSFSV